MSDDVDWENSSLTAEEKKIQMIEKITAAVIVVMKTANLVDISITAASAVIDVNNTFSKQFKSKNIEFFNSELNIEKDTIIINDKFWIQNVFIFIQQIKNIAAIKKKEIMKSNFSLYLWETAVI